MSFWKKISNWLNDPQDLQAEITVTREEWQDGQLTEDEWRDGQLVVSEMEDYSEIDEHDIRDYTDEWMFEVESSQSTMHDPSDEMELDI